VLSRAHGPWHAIYIIILTSLSESTEFENSQILDGGKYSSLSVSDSDVLSCGKWW